MTPLPVIPDVFRVTLGWRYGLQVTAANVLHFVDAASTGSEADLFAALGANLNNNMQETTALSTTLTSIDIIPLDGTSPTVSHTLDGTYVGRGAGEGIIQAATIISLHTSQRGPRGRGRVYWPFPGEGEVNMGQLNSDDRTLVEEGWSAFTTAMLADGWPLAVASYVHVDAHLVGSLTVKPITGTQRRRIDAIR